jgi:hypothetical protein
MLKTENSHNSVSFVLLTELSNEQSIFDESTVLLAIVVEEEWRKNT